MLRQSRCRQTKYSFITRKSRLFFDIRCFTASILVAHLTETRDLEHGYKICGSPEQLTAVRGVSRGVTSVTDTESARTHSAASTSLIGTSPLNTVGKDVGFVTRIQCETCPVLFNVPIRVA
jgi:hypothetical protein